MPKKLFTSATAKTTAAKAHQKKVEPSTAKKLANEVLRTNALLDKATEKSQVARENLRQYLRDNGHNQLYHRGCIFQAGYRTLTVETCPTSDNFKEVPPEPENEDELVDAANEGGDEENAA